jgi:uncharacterized Zn-binding protein involved in type VI secretion
MDQPAAKEGDRITAVDTHLVLPSSGGPPVAVPLPFAGRLQEALSTSVLIEGRPAAVVGSRAHNSPPHVAPGGTFQKAPANVAMVCGGSALVWFEDRPAARNGDPAFTCNDPADAPVGEVVASGAVLCG